MKLNISYYKKMEWIGYLLAMGHILDPEEFMLMHMEFMGIIRWEGICCRIEVVLICAVYSFVHSSRALMKSIGF